MLFILQLSICLILFILFNLCFFWNLKLIILYFWIIFIIMLNSLILLIMAFLIFIYLFRYLIFWGTSIFFFVIYNNFKSLLTVFFIEIVFIILFVCIIILFRIHFSILGDFNLKVWNIICRFFMISLRSLIKITYKFWRECFVLIIPFIVQNLLKSKLLGL